MKPRVTVPDPSDWLAALVRSLHLARWLLCLVGLAVTAACCAVGESWLDVAPPRWEEWFQRPGEAAPGLREAGAARSPAGVAFCLSLPLAVCGAVWSLVGAWIARQELLWRSDSRAGRKLVHGPGATALVLGRMRSLILCCVSPVLLVLVMFVPVVIAGRVNDWFGGLGATVVAVCLPLVLLGCVLLLVIGLGALSWPLMPVAIAAEATDHFDALSRAYNYFYQRMLAFVGLHAVALALSAAPVVVERYLLADALAGWSGEVRLGVAWMAAALAAAVFWSLEPLIYLHLRARIDLVEASELAGALAEVEKPSPPAKEEVKPSAAAADPGASLLSFVLAQALVIGTWCLTAWLFEHSGGEEAGWLGWGLVDGFVPPARGLYKLASVIGAIWGVLLVAMPAVVTLRRLLRGEPPAAPRA